MLNRRLIPDAPFAIAYSGGGDSTALVHMLRSYEPLVLIVDHALRPGSADEAQKAAEFAQSHGLRCRVLKWQHSAINSGLQEKSRHARYQLLGQACRENGIENLMTAHTLDDQAETLLMRYDRGTDWRGAAGMRAKAYAPLWPELAKVQLIRPLIDATRADLRAYNRANNLRWIEDVSNENRAFERIRARDYLAARSDMRDFLLETARDLQAARDAEARLFASFTQAHVQIGHDGIVHAREHPPRQLLARLARIASGTGGPIDRGKLKRLSSVFSDPGFKTATLAGCRIMAAGKGLIMGPDASVFKGRTNRSAIAEIMLDKNNMHIWDGRFAVRAVRSDLCVRPLWGLIQSLDSNASGRLRTTPEPFRGALPAATDNQGQIVAVPGIMSSPDIQFESLGKQRLSALSES